MTKVIFSKSQVNIGQILDQKKFIKSAGISILSKKYFFYFHTLFLYQIWIFMSKTHTRPRKVPYLRQPLKSPSLLAEHPHGDFARRSSVGVLAARRARRPHSKILCGGARRSASLLAARRVPHFCTSPLSARDLSYWGLLTVRG